MNVQRYAGMTVSDLTATLLDKGWQELGSGAAAFCFGKRGSGRVVKIVCGDAGQEAAVDLFEAHPEVEEFPRIYSWAWLAEPGCFAVEMERLTPQKEPDWEALYRADYSGDPRHQIRRSETYPGGPMDTIIGQRGADLIREVAFALGQTIDLHAANLMLRKDGTVVAVDPFYTGSSEDVMNRIASTITEHKISARKAA